MRHLPGWLVVFAVLQTGCESRPKAPAILDEPVYQNDAAGFRFLSPAGWTQHYRAQLPPGKLSQERMLVAYKRPASGQPASLEVSAYDLPEEELLSYLDSPSHGVNEWRSTGKAQTLTLNGVSAVRTVHRGRLGKQDMIKEVVAVRRGERVYLFTGFFQPKDSRAREEIRQAVESMMWKG